MEKTRSLNHHKERPHCEDRVTLEGMRTHFQGWMLSRLILGSPALRRALEWYVVLALNYCIRWQTVVSEESRRWALQLCATEWLLETRIIHNGSCWKSLWKFGSTSGSVRAKIATVIIRKILNPKDLRTPSSAIGEGTGCQMRSILDLWFGFSAHSNQAFHPCRIANWYSLVWESLYSPSRHSTCSMTYSRNRMRGASSKGLITAVRNPSLHLSNLRTSQFLHDLRKHVEMTS